MKLKKVLSGFMAFVMAVTSSVVMTVSSSAADTTAYVYVRGYAGANYQINFTGGAAKTIQTGTNTYEFSFTCADWDSAEIMECDIQFVDPDATGTLTDIELLSVTVNGVDKGVSSTSVSKNSWGDGVYDHQQGANVAWGRWIALTADDIAAIGTIPASGNITFTVQCTYPVDERSEITASFSTDPVTLTVNSANWDDTGKAAQINVPISAPDGVTYGTSTYADIKSMFKILKITDIEYITDSAGIGAANISITPFAQWDNESIWTQGTGVSMSTSSVSWGIDTINGVSEESVITRFGYQFNINGNGTAVADMNIGDTVIINGAATPATYSVSVSDTIENGTVTAEPTEAAEGDTVTLTATPAEGYELNAYTVTDVSDKAVTVTDGKFTMPDSAVTVSATFKAIDYTLTAATADGGSIYFHVDGNIAETANVGDAVYVIIEADDYYNLSSATANGVPVEACLFKMPAENVIVTPVFELDIEELKTDVDAALTSAILEATQPSAYTVDNLNTAIVNALTEISKAVKLTVDTSALKLTASTEEATGSITGTVTVKAGDTTITTATADVTLEKVPTDPVEIAYEAIVAYLETVTFDNDFHATKQAEAIMALVAEKAPDARVDPSFNVIVATYTDAGSVKGTIKIIADGYDSKTITVDKVIAVLEKTDEMLLEEAVAATETAIKDIATADGITKDVVTKAIANEDVTVTVKSEETKAPTTTEKGVQTVTITLKLGTLTETVTKTFDIDMLEVADEMIMEEAAAAAEDAIKAITSADEITAAAIEEAIANEDVTVTVKSEETKAPTTTAKGVQTVTITLTVGDVTETITKTFDIDMLPAGYQDAANTTIPEGKTVTQKTAVEDGVYSQRFIKKVSAEDLVGATKIVFTVSNGTKTATYESTKCYSSLNVNGGSLSAGDDYVFLGLTIKDIPENITVTIEDIEIVY